MRRTIAVRFRECMEKRATIRCPSDLIIAMACFAMTCGSATAEALKLATKSPSTEVAYVSCIRNIWISFLMATYDSQAITVAARDFASSLVHVQPRSVSSCVRFGAVDSVSINLSCKSLCSLFL